MVVEYSGINWTVCKSAHHSRMQITTPAPNHSVFLQAGCPSCHPTNNVKALKAWVIQSNCRKQNCEGKLSFVFTSFISTVQRMFSTTGLVANSKTSSFSAYKLHRMAFIHYKKEDGCRLSNKCSQRGTSGRD